MLITVTSSNLLDIEEMDRLRAELDQFVAQVQADPDTGLSELAAIWNEMAERPSFCSGMTDLRTENATRARRSYRPGPKSPGPSRPWPAVEAPETAPSDGEDAGTDQVREPLPLFRGQQRVDFLEKRTRSARIAVKHLRIAISGRRRKAGEDARHSRTEFYGKGPQSRSALEGGDLQTPVAMAGSAARRSAMCARNHHRPIDARVEPLTASTR